MLSVARFHQGKIFQNTASGCVRGQFTSQILQFPLTVNIIEVVGVSKRSMHEDWLNL